MPTVFRDVRLQEQSGVRREERQGEDGAGIGPLHGARRGEETSRQPGWGGGGVKGGGRGECEAAKYGPGTVRGNRVPGAEAHVAFRENIPTRRYTPEVGAVCPNWARTDLCGGREVTRVPTAKNIYSHRAFPVLTQAV